MATSSTRTPRRGKEQSTPGNPPQKEAPGTRLQFIKWLRAWVNWTPRRRELLAYYGRDLLINPPATEAHGEAARVAMRAGAGLGIKSSLYSTSEHVPEEISWKEEHAIFEDLLRNARVGAGKQLLTIQTTWEAVAKKIGVESPKTARQHCRCAQVSPHGKKGIVLDITLAPEHLRPQLMPLLAKG